MEPNQKEIDRDESAGKTAGGQMVDADCMVEPRMGRPGVHQVGQPQLPNVPKPLERGGIDDADRYWIHSDGVPERIPDDQV